jgi:hypothetical protein
MNWDSSYINRIHETIIEKISFLGEDLATFTLVLSHSPAGVIRRAGQGRGKRASRDEAECLVW